MRSGIKTQFSFLFFFFIFSFLLLAPQISFASEGLLGGLSSSCLKEGDCTLCDMVRVFSNVARAIMGLTGGVALFFFVLGGFRMIASQGNKEEIEKGKTLLKQTFFAILIILSAWQLTRVFIIVLVTPTGDAKRTKISEKIIEAFKDPSAFNPCEEKEKEKSEPKKK
jgi:hypothetical protein